jgi:3-hydroxyisobutyrate dehydrogenase-like beta-hydroxyacid dehydrogenase
MKIGFIGLGNMGGPMCRNIAKGNMDVVAWDLRPEAIEACVAAGARAGTSLADTVADADIVMTSLPMPDNVRDAVLGEGGIAEHMRPDAVYVDLSTNAPSNVREIGAALAERGIAMLDAPVSGGVAGAEAATIAIMAGGDAKAFEACLPVFHTFGKTVVHVGELGTGSVAKLINNMMAFTNMAAAAEGLTLGAAAGIDPDILVDIIANSSGNSFALPTVAKKARAGDWSANFSLNLANKDMRLAFQLASELNMPLGIAGQAQTLMRMAHGMGYGEDDVTSIMRVLEVTTGHTVRD